MKTRMASARCCCGPGGPGGPIPCDPITGITDSFQELQTSTGDGGWIWVTSLSMNPFVQPIGTLVLDQNAVFGEDYTFFRCSVWSDNFSNIRHYLKGQFENYGSEIDLIRGPSVYARFSLLGAGRIWSLSHDIAFVLGTGWRHRFTLQHPGATDAIWYAGPIVQAAQFPAPTGPFDSEIQFVQFKLLSGAWQVTAYFNGSVLGSRSTATPTNTNNTGGTEAEWSHGFAGTADMQVARIDRWQYFAST